MVHVTTAQIPGMPTKLNRRLYVFTPRDYARSGRSYPVLYMFDGHNVFYDSHATYGKCWGMKEYLERTKLPLIVAAVECNPEGNKRLSEYTPWGFAREGLGTIRPQGRQTMDWMVQRFKPWVDQHFRTLPDRDHTYLAGSSMGGLMTLFGLVEYNRVFSRGAALSPSLWVGQRKLPALIRSKTLERPTRIWMDLGSAELPEAEHREMAVLFETAALLTQSGAEVAARIVPGAEHNEAAWEKRIPLFFDYLLKD